MQTRPPPVHNPARPVIPLGVIVDHEIQRVFAYAKTNGFALPAVSWTGTDTVNAGMDDYLAKPIRMEQLVAALGKVPTPPVKKKV